MDSPGGTQQTINLDELALELGRRDLEILRLRALVRTLDERVTELMAQPSGDTAETEDV